MKDILLMLPKAVTFGILLGYAMFVLTAPGQVVNMTTVPAFTPELPQICASMHWEGLASVNIGGHAYTPAEMRTLCHA